MRRLSLLAAGLLAVGLTAFADDTKKPADDKKTDKKDDKKGFDDAEFVREAASGGMLEVELGKLAASMAKTDDVRKFGQKMVDDHSKANEQLKMVAKKAGLTVSDKLLPDHQKMLDKFQAMKDGFDKEYVKDMLKDHEEDVADFKKASKEAKDAGLKEFAAKTLPTLEEHLAMVKKLNDKSK